MEKLDYVSLDRGLPRCPLKETCCSSNLADIKHSVPRLLLNEKLHTWIAARHFSVSRYLIHLSGLYVWGLMCQTWRKANPSWCGFWRSSPGAKQVAVFSELQRSFRGHWRLPGKWSTIWLFCRNILDCTNGEPSTFVPLAYPYSVWKPLSQR